MAANSNSICVIGGMNMDVLGYGCGTLTLRDSNIGHIRFTSGGVGRNIAEKIAQKGIRTELFTALGNDMNAAYLEEACRKNNIGLQYSIRTQKPAPVYMAVHDETGDMFIAMNDMTAMDDISKEALLERIDQLNTFGMCVLDANLKLETLMTAVRSLNIPLLLDPVSCEKAVRCLPALPYLTAIKPNLIEALAMTGTSCVQEAATKLLQTGVKNIYISLGKKGVYYACREEHKLLPAKQIKECIQTGAGDAMCAGIAEAMLQGKDAYHVANNGLESAYRHLIGNIPQQD